MKKILAVLMGMALIFGAAGNAAAFIQWGSFASTVTDGTNEFAGVLDGDAYDGIDTASINNYFTLADMTEAGSFAELQFGGVAGNVTGSMLENYDIWATVVDPASLDADNMSGDFSAVGAIQGFNSNATPNPTETIQSIGTGYGLKATLNTDLTKFLDGPMSMDLGAFDAWTAGDEISIAMDIYHFSSNDWSTTWTYEDTNVDLVLTMGADGTISTSTVVPVPGALVLLGSGLLGLIGIRRKRA